MKFCSWKTRDLWGAYSLFARSVWRQMWSLMQPTLLPADLLASQNGIRGNQSIEMQEHEKWQEMSTKKQMKNPKNISALVLSSWKVLWMSIMTGFTLPIHLFNSHQNYLNGYGIQFRPWLIGVTLLLHF